VAESSLKKNEVERVVVTNPLHWLDAYFDTSIYRLPKVPYGQPEVAPCELQWAVLCGPEAVPCELQWAAPCGSEVVPCELQWAAPCGSEVAPCELQGAVLCGPEAVPCELQWAVPCGSEVVPCEQPEAVPCELQGAAPCGSEVVPCEQPEAVPCGLQGEPFEQQGAAGDGCRVSAECAQRIRAADGPRHDAISCVPCRCDDVSLSGPLLSFRA
jgi:hypothetical protein